jgi:Protein of unknown function (DUF4232)
MKRLLPLLAVPALLLAGCSSGNSTTAAPTASATGAVGTAPTTAPTTATSTTDPASPSASATAKNSVTGTPRCHTGDLTVKTGTGQGAAGTQHTNLVFADKSDHPCTLTGYPGVSWVTGDSGTQVNDPFKRAAGTKRTVTLVPGGKAHAVLVTHAALNFAAGQCKPTDVRGYRIYPPDETAAIFVSAPGKQCSAKGVNLGEVQLIASGPGQEDD